jgi:hypothetical protein
MNYNLIILLVVCAAFAAFLFVPWQSRRLKFNKLSDVEAQWRTVDLGALANLLDPREEQFLRRNLDDEEYKTIYRERISVTREYISNITHNAKLMVRAGQIMLQNRQGEEAAYVRELVKSSSSLRLTLLKVQMRLAYCYAFPRAETNLSAVVHDYGAVAERVQMAMAFESSGA